MDSTPQLQPAAPSAPAAPKPVAVDTSTRPRRPRIGDSWVQGDEVRMIWIDGSERKMTHKTKDEIHLMFSELTAMGESLNRASRVLERLLQIIEMKAKAEKLAEAKN